MIQDQPSKPVATPPIRCTFCGNDRDACKHLISGHGNSYICDECVELCGHICARIPTCAVLTCSNEADPRFYARDVNDSPVMICDGHEPMPQFFEVAARPPATTTSGLALVAGHFEVPPFVVPNSRGEAFKIEQVIYRSPEATEKLVWWFGPDEDRDPHNHPWAFDSEILAGGYTSITYWIDEGIVKTEERVVRAGDRVHYPRHEYHVVKDVLPATRTRMICGPASPGNAWGYLDPATGREYPAKPDPTFMDRMLALNPWRKP